MTEIRWRLQLLAELGVGRLLRHGQQIEDERFTRLKEATS